MSYKSKHTGAQVDEAVSKVLNGDIEGSNIKDGSVPLSALSSEVQDKIENAGGGAGGGTTPDWSAMKGEEGYIENKPFGEIIYQEDIGRSELDTPMTEDIINSHRMNFDEWDVIRGKYYETLIHNIGYLSLDGITIVHNVNYTSYQEPPFAGKYDIIYLFPGDIKYIPAGYDGNIQISYNSNDDGSLYIDITVTEFVGDLKNHLKDFTFALFTNWESAYLKNIDDKYIPSNIARKSDIPTNIIKTTPQTLSTKDKNQVKENLGITDELADLSAEVNKNPFEKGDNEHSAVLKGGDNQAKGNFSTAEGHNTFAKGDFSHAEGQGEKLQFTVTNITEVGDGTTFFYVNESTEGLQHGDILCYTHGSNEIWAYVFGISDNIIKVTQRFSPKPAAGGVLTVVKGLAYGQNSHSQNAKTVAFGDNSHAEGFLTSVRGFAAHGEGVQTKSDGWASHAEGQKTKASGDGSHAEGQDTKAYGKSSHAEGQSSESNGEASHAEGHSTNASGNMSHAEGYRSSSIGEFGHSEGFGTISKGLASHAEGYMTETGEYANASHAEGYMTKTTNVFEHAQGRCNLSHQLIPADLSAPTPEEMSKATLYSVGIGMPTKEDDPTSAIRMNAHEIMQDGKCFIIGIGGYDGTNAVSPNAQSVVAKSVQEVINLGIDPVVWKYMFRPIHIYIGDPVPTDMLLNNGKLKPMPTCCYYIADNSINNNNSQGIVLLPADEDGELLVAHQSLYYYYADENGNWDRMEY